MIKNLKVRNFKSLKDVNLVLGKMNILSGTNSSGKTSIIHSLLFLSQNANSNKYAQLNGKLVQLGKYEDVKNFTSSITEDVLIEGSNHNGKYSLIINKDEVSENLVEIKEATRLKEFQYENDIFYISANRIGIKDVHESGNNLEHFGLNGEYAVDYLIKNRDQIVANRLVHDLVKDAPNTLMNEVDYWLERITGSRLKGSEIENTNKSVITFSHKQSERFVRSINTGSGISYVLSIIILCLGVSNLIDLDRNTPTIIIENPEIHLHPKAQSLLTEFLIFVSNHIQLIVETQSDHVFNSFRVNVYNRKLAAKDIKANIGTVHFLEYQDNQTKVYNIEFTGDGRVKNHKSDLFEQFDIDVMRLLGVRKDGKSTT